MATTYEDKQISQPIVLSHLLNGESIATVQAPFALTEADFLRLQGGPPRTATFATIVFSGVTGYAISLGPKFEPVITGGSSQLTSGENTTLVLGFISSIFLYGVGYFWRNDRKKVMGKISKHFETSKPSTHLFGGMK